MIRKAIAVVTIVFAASVAADLGPAQAAGRPARTWTRTSLDIQFQPISGYLSGLLRVMRIPVESQVALFSPTSAQARLISAENPRVIYFSDDVAVGWVRGSQVIEVAETNPDQGVAFYTVSQNERVKPALTENAGCARCHQSSATLGVPGLLTLSTAGSSRDGMHGQSLVTDHRTPFGERWGGWYVTGRSTGWKHEGNRVGQGWLVSLYDQFYDDGYLGKYSDIVALMVLEHQTRMTNLLTVLGRQVRDNAPAAAFNQQVKETVDYMLFVDEAPLPARIIGTSGFTEYFAQQGPRDSKGRSLREFDLRTRLFKYPCSYMIDSEAFRQLPPRARAAVYDRLADVLSGRASDSRYSRLSRSDRQALLEILRDTQPAFRLPA